MIAPDTGSRGAGNTPVDVMTPPLGQSPDRGQPGRRLRKLVALAGIAGPVLLVAYFITPLFVGWPSATESAGKVAAYAGAHRVLFYLGGWLQGTGAALSVVFLLVLLQHSGARRTVAGSVTLIGCAVLLSVVAVEAAMLEAVAVAAGNHDLATVATGFQLVSGVFVRIYPLVPAPLVFGGIGFALSGTSILPRVLARTALAISALFVVAGLAAVFGTPGFIFATVMSVAEAIWIPAAAIAFVRRTARAGSLVIVGESRSSR
jgi:hypothetical protein